MLCLLLVVLSVISVLIYFVLISKPYICAYRSVKQLPQLPSTSWFWGSTGPLTETPDILFKSLRTWAKTYYPIYGARLAYFSTANFLHPHDFETILSSMNHNTKGTAYRLLENWLGKGLLTSDGHKWQRRRKILTPAFHFNILQTFVIIFHEETEHLIQMLKSDCDKPHISINAYISDFTLNTIGKTTMGTNFNNPNETIECKEYKNAVYGMGKMIFYKFFRPWLSQFKPINYFSSSYSEESKLLKTLHNFTSKVIFKRERKFKSLDTSSKRLAMLDVLIKAKLKDAIIDDEGIREEVDTFLFEGHDTVAASISFTLMLLACHRDIQDKVFEEIQETLRENTKPDYNTLQNMKYTERCIKESLRLYPSVPFISRILGEDITTYSGHKLIAGVIAHLHIYDVHHNPDVYPDPEKFDPDRFLPENCMNRHNFAYLPFSAGPRNCIGQKFAILEIKSVLCGILKHFILEPVDTPDTIKLVVDIILRAEDSIRVKFVPRQ